MSSTNVLVPDIGDFTDIPVIEIHVAPGTMVRAEDPLVTLESDKATMDIPAPADGEVRELHVKLGDRVSQGSVLLVLESVEATTGSASGPPAPAGPSAPAGETASPDPVIAPPAPGPETTDGDSHEFELVVIGAGPGGYTAAFRAADLGLRVCMIERDERLGGVCLNVGCIPSKALLHAARSISEAEEMSAHGITFGDPSVDLDALYAWKESVVKRLTGGLDGLAKRRKVEVIHGEAKLTGPNGLRVADRDVGFAHAIIAVGSRPVSLPFMPSDPRVMDSTGALELEEIPDRLLVIGGGIIGLEMACVYDALGSAVTVVELMDGLMPGCDRDLVKPLEKRIRERYEQIITGEKVVAASAGESGIEVEFGSGEKRTYDRVLVSVGRVPNGHTIEAEAAGVHVDERGFIAVDRQMRTNVPNILAIGDVVGGPMLAHKASHEGRVAAEVIAGEPGAEFAPVAIPNVAYTDPEVAWAGLTETEAEAEGVAYDKASFPWAASGRALSIGRDEGLTKLLLEPGTRRVLGAGIVGINAGELIAEAVLAIEMGADAEDLAMTIHPHPTLSETVAFAAELGLGTITDLMPLRSARKSSARS